MGSAVNPPDAASPAEARVAQALADCDGDKDAALLLLAHLLVNAQRGMSAGMLRLPPASCGEADILISLKAKTEK